VLIVDEAHATGVFGDGGRGMADARLPRATDLITVHTCGKALGCEGALICAPADRPGLPHQPRTAVHLLDRAVAADRCIACAHAIRIVAAEPERRERLMRLADHAERKLAPLGDPRDADRRSSRSFIGENDSHNGDRGTIAE
jgi:8-amino-7-oxononanoate synthase